MLSKFAARRPVSNFFLYWALTIWVAVQDAHHHGSSPIFSFVVALFLTSYCTWYPLAIYKYLIDDDVSIRNYVSKNYANSHLEIWIFILSLVISIASSISIDNQNIANSNLFGVFAAPFSVALWWVYARVCWRTSKLLEKCHDIKMGISPGDGYDFTPPHELTFLALLAWPGLGIFHVGDRILPVLRRERRRRAAN